MDLIVICFKTGNKGGERLKYPFVKIVGWINFVDLKCDLLLTLHVRLSLKFGLHKVSTSMILAVTKTIFFKIICCNPDTYFLFVCNKDT